MRADEIHNNTDPNELRNILKRMKVGQRPPSVLIVNQAPDQYVPPDTTTGGGDLGVWFNVRDYGATGDGVTDDSNAINSAIAAMNAAGRGVLYFPAGAYLAGTLTTISVYARVVGDGTGDATRYVSRITCNLPTGTLFTLSQGGIIQDLEIRSSSAGNTTTGIYITVAGSTARTDLIRVRMVSFYISIDVLNPHGLYMDGCRIIGSSALYGLHCQNVFPQGSIAFAIRDTSFFNSTATGVAIKFENGGGSMSGPISGCDFYNFATGILADIAGSYLQIENNTFNDHVCIDITSANYVLIVGNYLNGPTLGGADGRAILLDSVSQLAIASNIFLVGNTTLPAVDLTNVALGRLSAHVYTGNAEFLSLTSCTDVVDLDAGGAAGGKYRQFAWADDGSGGWEFISAGGEPVLHLAETEL